MPTTKKKLSDQIISILKGGSPSAAFPIDSDEIEEYAGQLISQKLKVEYAGFNIKDGETIPSGYVIATYTGIPVVADGNLSYALMPAYPILLPRNMGLYEVSPDVSQNADYYVQFIPMAPGERWLLQNEPLISDVLGQIGYELFGDRIRFTKNLLAITSPIPTVTVRLIIMDISKYDDYTLLPIPEDMEASIIQEAVQFFSGEQPADRKVDNLSDSPQNAKP